MNVLSLFDGMSCGQIALKELGFTPDKYYASEIDKYAIAQTKLNFPNTIHIGSVVDVDITQLEPIDLLLGGSPCQSFSFAGKRKGMATKCEIEITKLEQYLELKEQGFEFEGQSYLFWEYMRILTDIRKYNPDVIFLLENVEMGSKWERVLSEAIGIFGVHINSALVSAQNRKRIYWFGQNRERFYYSENYCCDCNNKRREYEKRNRGIQTTPQGNGVEKILEFTSKRHIGMCSMQNDVFKNKSKRNNENLFNGMPKSTEKDNREESIRGKQREKNGVQEEILSREQRFNDSLCEIISEIGCRKISNEESRLQFIKEMQKEYENTFKEGDRWNYCIEDGRFNINSKYETDMYCVCCGKELNHRPYNSVVSYGDKRDYKPTGTLSKMQFQKARQNNGRIFDVFRIGVKGLDSLFGETDSDIPQPEDMGILLRDILEENVDQKYFLSDKMNMWLNKHSENSENKGNGFKLNIKEEGDKCSCLTSGQYKQNLSTDYLCIPCDFRSDEGIRIKSDGKSGTLCARARNDESCGQMVFVATVQKDNLIMQLSKRQKTNLKDGNEESDATLSTSLNGSQSNGMILINSINKHNEKRENKRRSCEILLALREEINSKKNVEREMAVYARFFEDEVLFKRMYEKFISESEVRAENYKEWEKPSSKNVTNCNVLNMQFENWYRCSSQRQKSIKQFIRQLAACMSELSQQNTSSKESMHYLWQTTKRVWVLRKALSEIQKIWEPICSETKPVQQSGRIRRLTPTEASRLQTIPSWYKWACSETQQYKLLGNGWTIEVIKHIFKYLI